MARLFEDDGCTLSPESWRGIDLSACCNVHDEAFAYGKQAWEFLTANIELYSCAVSKGAWDWGTVALIVTMGLGWIPFFFGYKKLRAESVAKKDANK